jgi:hypothetical protein
VSRAAGLCPDPLGACDGGALPTDDICSIATRGHWFNAPIAAAPGEPADRWTLDPVWTGKPGHGARHETSGAWRAIDSLCNTSTPRWTGRRPA